MVAANLIKGHSVGDRLQGASRAAAQLVIYVKHMARQTGSEVPGIKQMSKLIYGKENDGTADGTTLKKALDNHNAATGILKLKDREAKDSHYFKRRALHDRNSPAKHRQSHNANASRSSIESVTTARLPSREQNRSASASLSAVFYFHHSAAAHSRWLRREATRRKDLLEKMEEWPTLEIYALPPRCKQSKGCGGARTLPRHFIAQQTSASSRCSSGLST